MITFEWDEGKDKLNQKKHNVSFDEGRSVFYDTNAVQFFDKEHSGNEERFIMLGMSRNLRILIVCHSVKENDDVIRIISARKATASERTYYTGK